MWNVLKIEDVDEFRRKLFADGYVKHGHYVLVDIDDLCVLLKDLKKRGEELRALRKVN